MKAPWPFLVSLLGVFLLGMGLGYQWGTRPNRAALQPQEETILDDAGSRVLQRVMVDAEPSRIAPEAGPVLSEIRVKAQAIAQPETLVELRFQEVQTLEGPRIVAEAPEGWRIVGAVEERARHPLPVTMESRLSVGPVLETGTGGTRLGIAAAWTSRRWTWTATATRAGATVGALWRF